MPTIKFICQDVSCSDDDNPAKEYWQCKSCRTVMCRPCWERNTLEDPGRQKGGFWEAVGKLAAWSCPKCRTSSSHHKIYPLQ